MYLILYLEFIGRNRMHAFLRPDVNSLKEITDELDLWSLKSISMLKAVRLMNYKE